MKINVYQYHMALKKRYLTLFWGVLVFILPAFAISSEAPVLTVDSGRVLLSIPQNTSGYELRITAQIDSGMGLIHYGLPTEGPYLLQPSLDSGVIGLVDVTKAVIPSLPVSDDLWQTPAMTKQNALQLPPSGWDALFSDGLAQVDLTDRLLTGDGLYQINHPDLDREEVDLAQVVAVDTCFGGCLVHMRRYFNYVPRVNVDESLKMSGLIPVSVSVFLTCVPSDNQQFFPDTKWFVSPRLPESVRNTLKDILGQSGEKDSLGSSVFEGHAYASTRRAVAYDVSARDVCLQQFSAKGFVRLLVPGAMSSKDVLALLIRKGYGMKSLPDCRSVYQISSDSLLRQHLYAVLRTDKKDVSEYDVQNDESLILKSDSLTELYFKRAEELAQAVHEASVNGSSVISIAAIGDALHQVWLDDVVQPLCKALMLVSDKRQARRLSECFVEQQCRLLTFYTEEGSVLCGHEGAMDRSRASWDLLWHADFWQKRYERIISSPSVVNRDVVLEAMEHSLRRHRRSLVGSVARRCCLESAKTFIGQKKEEENSVLLSDSYKMLLHGWFAPYKNF